MKTAHVSRLFTVLSSMLLLACVVASRARPPQPIPTPVRPTSQQPVAVATATAVKPSSTEVSFLPLVSAPAATAQPTPSAAVQPAPRPTPVLKKGYGINVKGVNYTDDSLEKAIDLGFEWVKIYDHPPPERLPFRVLYRVNLPRPDEDWNQWANYRFIDAQLYADRIDAYEIGNEPNLIEEWGRNPDPAAYAELLKLAYRTIKAADPDALVVSAGLAPVGASGDPRYMNDLEFLRIMYEHGAAGNFDILGMHPFGFSYAPDTDVNANVCEPPDRSYMLSYVRVEGPAFSRGCWNVDGLCFRRAEQLREIMVRYGDTDTPVWATEFGWILFPPDCCRTKSDWPARYWQAVSEKAQATYLVDAFAYAREHWPWMQVMFLWNLDYSRYDPGDDPKCLYCDSMGWFSILNPDGSPRQAYRCLLDQ